MQPIFSVSVSGSVNTPLMFFGREFSCKNNHGDEVALYFVVVCRSERKREIAFHDVDDLGVVVQTFSVSPRRPGRLCTVSSTTLLYIDDSTMPREVLWLDCTTSPPEPTSGRHITHTQDDVISDLCCVQHPNKQLLITVHKSGGINSYNTSSNKREWCVRGELTERDENICPRRIVTDGCGHLFVIDRGNDCVQMFSTDSVYMGRLLREERCFGRLSKIDWCSDTSSLVVLHKRNRKYEISRVQETTSSSEEDISEFSDESPMRQDQESPISRHSFSSRSALSVGNDANEDDDDTDLQDETIYIPEADEILWESDDDTVLDEPLRKKSLWDVVSRNPRVSEDVVSRNPRMSEDVVSRKPRVPEEVVSRKPRVSEDVVSRKPRVPEDVVSRKPRVSENVVSRKPRVYEDVVSRKPRVYEDVVSRKPRVYEDVVSRKPRVSEDAVSRKPGVSRKPRVSESDFNGKGKYIE